MGVGKLVVNQQNLAMAPATTPGAAAGNGLSIDRQGYFSAMVMIAAATITSGSLVATIQHSSDNSTWTDLQVNGSTLTTDTLTASNTHTNEIIDISGAERYIRVVTATTGTVSAFTATVLLNDRQYGTEWENEGQYSQDILNI